MAKNEKHYKRLIAQHLAGALDSERKIRQLLEEAKSQLSPAEYAQLLEMVLVFMTTIGKD